MTETFIPPLLFQRAPVFPVSCHKYREPARSAQTPNACNTTARPGKCRGSQWPGGDEAKGLSAWEERGCGSRMQGEKTEGRDPGGGEEKGGL